MYIVVIGMGQVGRHLLRTLAWERHDIVAVDHCPDAISAVEEHHDVMTVTGYGASVDVLRKAGVAEADLVAAVTDVDEVNLLAAIAAREMGAKRVVARVQGTDWTDPHDGVRYNFLGIDVVINPHVLLAQEIAKIARSHGAIEVFNLAEDRIEVVQVELEKGSRMLNRPLSKLTLPDDILVAAIVRRDELRVPGGADVLLPEDRVYLVGRRTQMEAAEGLFTSKREAQRVLIIGGGVVATAIARLIGDQSEVVIIEQDGSRARALAEEHPLVTVIHGDGTDLSLLQDEHVERFDLVCVVSPDDEVNLMVALLAKQAGALRTLSLVNRPDYMGIYRQLGVDIVLSPRITASDHILRYCRDAELKSLTLLEGGKAELLEFVATAGSRALDKPLRRLSVPRGGLIAAIVRNEEVIIPNGDSVIQADDHVVVLAAETARSAMGRLFKARRS